MKLVPLNPADPLSIGATPQVHRTNQSQSASRIRHARTRAKLSQAELARRVGVRSSAAAQWEGLTGTMPSVVNLARIAVATAVAFEWLATGRGSMSVEDPHSSPFQMDDFAHDHWESRILQLARALPESKKRLFVEFLESWRRR